MVIQLKEVSRGKAYRLTYDKGPPPASGLKKRIKQLFTQFKQLTHLSQLQAVDKSVAALVVKLATTPGWEVRQNLGVNKPHTAGEMGGGQKRLNLY